MSPDHELHHNTSAAAETLKTRDFDASPMVDDPVLRRLVGRLCLAGLGRSAELDAQLKQISQMARTGLDPAGIQALLDPLTRAVTALDEPTPADKATSDSGSSDSGSSDTGASNSGQRPDQSLQDQREQLQREKAELQALLRQIDSHLETLASFFSHEEQHRTHTSSDTNRLNTLVLDEVQGISAEIGTDYSLTELRNRVDSRLSVIKCHINDFRSREQRRQVEQTGRMKALKVRVAELEQESRGLQHSLREEQRLALIDALTGIPNRAAWDERVVQEYARWQSQGGVVCMLVWDVDHFKAINDEYGHKAGDKMLRVLAQYLARELRTTDFVARYGGEEFVMLLAESDADTALKTANRIRAKVPEIAFHFRETPVVVTLSCGITTFRMGDTPDSAFERADRALYAAKDAGRNRCVVR